MATDDAQEIELTHARLRTLAHLRLERFTKATVRRASVARSDISQKLCLRQNQLSSLLVAPSDAESTDAPARPLESLTALRDLDLYDNRLTSVDGLATLSELECAREHGSTLTLQILRCLVQPAPTHPRRCVEDVQQAQDRLLHSE